MSPEFIARQRAVRRAMLGELYAARAEGRIVYARDLTAQPRRSAAVSSTCSAIDFGAKEGWQN